MKTTEPAAILHRLATDSGIPRGLSTLGVPADAIPSLAESVSALGIPTADVLDLFHAAWRGDTPLDPDPTP